MEQNSIYSRFESEFWTEILVSRNKFFLIFYKKYDIIYIENMKGIKKMFESFACEIQSDEIASLINQWDEDLEEMENMINSMVEYTMAISSNG